MSNMFEKTLSVEKIIDAALLALWYAEQWDKKIGYPGDVQKRQVEDFRLKAFSYAYLLYTEVGLSGGPFVQYKGISVPADWVPYFQEREGKYQHPID